MKPIDREKMMRDIQSSELDVLIVGGGINGAASAASLSAQGLKVGLIERGDFASETSQASSNMVWGGIKYLQSGAFRLVYKLCQSRNRLLDAYPLNVKEIRYYACLQKGAPPRLLIYLGAWLYWLIGKGYTAPPRLLSRKEIQDSTGINCRGGVEYSDAYLPENDARFTFRFIAKAWQQDALAINYIEATDFNYQNQIWETKARDTISGASMTIKSQLLINACGPGIDQLNRLTNLNTNHTILRSKGVHLIVPRLDTVRRVLTFFSSDERLFFALPMGTRTCIGTTDTPQQSSKARVTDEDIRFILDNINTQLQLETPLTKEDVIATRCGVRPLVKEVKEGDSELQDGEWIQLSRKHVIEVDKENKAIHVFGGKLTDCLNIGEEVIESIESLGLPMRSYNEEWFGETEANQDFLLRANAAGLSEKQSLRLWRRYSESAQRILDFISDDHSLGNEITKGSGILKAEIAFTQEQEMVILKEDFTRRRTMLDLEFPGTNLNPPEQPML